MIANITASQCLIVRQAQLHAEGKLTDAHAALAKAFTTSKVLLVIELRFRDTISALEIRRAVWRLKGNIRAQYPEIRQVFFGAESITEGGSEINF